MKKISFVVIIVIIVTGLLVWWRYDKKTFAITNFEECVAAKNLVAGSSPRQCQYKNQTFIELTNKKDEVSNTSTITDKKQDGASPPKSGIQGQVSLGPTCPVMTNPPDPKCADKSYQTTIQVSLIGNTKNPMFKAVGTDKEGYYKVMLPPGRYSIKPMGMNPFPRCEAKSVVVESDIVFGVDFSCDNGIR